MKCFFYYLYIAVRHKMWNSCKFTGNYDYYHTAPTIKCDVNATIRKSWNYFCLLWNYCAFDKDPKLSLLKWKFHIILNRYVYRRGLVYYIHRPYTPRERERDLVDVLVTTRPFGFPHTYHQSNAIVYSNFCHISMYVEYVLLFSV